MHAQSCELYQIAAAKADDLLTEETKQPTILLLEKKVVDSISGALHEAEIKAQHAFQTVKESVITAEETLQEATKKIEETSHQIVEKTKTRLSFVTNLLRAQRHRTKAKESTSSLGHLSLEEGLEENNNDKHKRNKSLPWIEEVTTEKLLEITHDECALEPPHYYHHSTVLTAPHRITTAPASSTVTVEDPHL